MADTNLIDWSSQSPLYISTSAKSASRPPIDFTGSTTQDRSLSHAKQQGEPSSKWFTVQHDFEQRLSRFGIKVSEANKDPAPSPAQKSIVLMRPPIDAHVTADGYCCETTSRDVTDPANAIEGLPLLETVTMACFTNDKKESKLDATERKLRQARTEAQIWKEKFETQARDLRVSYSETMEWRMKYEDLYSAVLQDRDVQSSELRVKREGTKSLG